MNLENRTAVVTGAGRGMGRTHALTLAARGANVVVNDLGGTAEGVGTDQSPAAEVVKEVEAAGGKAIANYASVSEQEGAESIVADAVEAFGGLDIVVNNAGILTKHVVPESGLDDLEHELGVHLKGSFNVTRAAWPHLVESDAARVVCTASCGILGSPVLLSYAAAKAGVIGMCRSLAISGEEHGIKVNMVAPYALTRMADPDLPVNKAARSEVDPEMADKFGLLEPELVSAVVAYLASAECAITGEILSAGGGLVARMFIAESQGFSDPGLTPEMVAENLEQIMDTTDPIVLGDVTDYTNVFIPRVPVPASAG